MGEVNKLPVLVWDAKMLLFDDDSMDCLRGQHKTRCFVVVAHVSLVAGVGIVGVGTREARLLSVLVWKVKTMLLSGSGGTGVSHIVPNRSWTNSGLEGVANISSVPTKVARTTILLWR